MTLGQSCITDNTTYIDFAPSGFGEQQQQYTSTVTRDNCRWPYFSCDPAEKVCVPTKPVGSACTTDVECQTVRSLLKRSIILPASTLYPPYICIVRMRSVRDVR